MFCLKFQFTDGTTKTCSDTLLSLSNDHMAFKLSLQLPPIWLQRRAFLIWSCGVMWHLIYYVVSMQDTFSWKLSTHTTRFNGFSENVGIFLSQLSNLTICRTLIMSLCKLKQGPSLSLMGIGIDFGLWVLEHYSYVRDDQNEAKNYWSERWKKVQR